LEVQIASLSIMFMKPSQDSSCPLYVSPFLSSTSYGKQISTWLVPIVPYNGVALGGRQEGQRQLSVRR